MDKCCVEYHRPEEDEALAPIVEKELDPLMKRHGLTRQGSGFRVEERIRDITYEALKTRGKG